MNKKFKDPWLRDQGFKEVQHRFLTLNCQQYRRKTGSKV